MNNFKHILVLLLLIAAPVACVQKQQHQATSTELRVGLDPNYAPFEIRNGAGDLVGFDIELMAEICRLAGWQARYVEITFGDLLAELTAGNIDVAISAMTITPQREVVVAFSDPYYLAGQTIAVPVEDSVTRFLSDLRGKRVGVQSGTTAEQLVKRTDGALIFPYRDIAAAFKDLSDGKLDAIVNDYPATRVLVDADSGLQIVGQMLNVEYYGIAVRRDDSKRLDRINSALAVLIGQGVHERLHNKWFGYPLLDIRGVDSTES